MKLPALVIAEALSSLGGWHLSADDPAHVYGFPRQFDGHGLPVGHVLLLPPGVSPPNAAAGVLGVCPSPAVELPEGCAVLVADALVADGEEVYLVALGELDDLMLSKIGYIMFHYWNNQEATAYRITNSPRIVSKQNIPDGYLLRLATNVQKFLLLEYVPGKPADIGVFDIMKVQRKGKGRYMPFVTQQDNII